MKTNYVTPSIDVIEIEIEDAILNPSELKVESNGLQNYEEYIMGW